MAVIAPEHLPDHPCMNDRAHHHVARIHLPVARRCNIRCGYCERSIGISADRTERPGICEAILNPDGAVRQARDFLSEWGPRAIVGIAGPGDPLANPETFKTLELLARDLPDARLCLCTNGLNLPDSVERLSACGLGYVTVTINGVDPAVTSRIHHWVEDGGIRKTGMDGAEILRDRQLRGIEMAVRAGMFVKVNTVAVPGINMDHIPVIAKLVARLGASVMNVMPLIPMGAFGHLTAPCRSDMAGLYRACGEYLSVFTSCKQCRADARGIPGKERCAWKKTA
jgi:nitrogen fixation protein NifB